MIFTNLDIIVRRTLLEKNIPIHFYLEFLLHASASVRELTFDTLKVINTEFLPVDSYNAVDLPGDFVDDLCVYLPVGGMLQEVPKNYNLTPLRNRNSSGEFVPYTNSTVNGLTENILGIQPQWLWFWNVNDWGEPTGRFFGAPGGVKGGYNVFKERRQIQLAPELVSTGIVLSYISDGQRADNATQIDVQATATIQSYIAWKSGTSAAHKDSGEARTYYNERRILRGHLNELTKADLLNIIRNNTHAAIKS